MKKTLLLFGLFVLSLPLIFTSCNDDDYEEVIIPDNVITLGNAISPITSVYNKVENDDTYIIVNTNAMQLILELDNKQSIPTGIIPRFLVVFANHVITFAICILTIFFLGNSGQKPYFCRSFVLK